MAKFLWGSCHPPPAQGCQLRCSATQSFASVLAAGMVGAREPNSAKTGPQGIEPVTICVSTGLVCLGQQVVVLVQTSAAVDGLG